MHPEPMVKNAKKQGICGNNSVIRAEVWKGKGLRRCHQQGCHIWPQRTDWDILENLMQFNFELTFCLWVVRLTQPIFIAAPQNCKLYNSEFCRAGFSKVVQSVNCDDIHYRIVYPLTKKMKTNPDYKENLWDLWFFILQSASNTAAENDRHT